MSQWVQTMPTLEYDYGEDEVSEWLDIGPTVEEESGWGVEESEYTTGLDYSNFTPEQVRQVINLLTFSFDTASTLFFNCNHQCRTLRPLKRMIYERHAPIRTYPARPPDVPSDKPYLFIKHELCDRTYLGCPHLTS